MKKLSLSILLSGILSIAALPSQAQSGVFNPYNPNNIWQQNINMQFTQMIHRQALRRNIAERNGITVEELERQIEARERQEAGGQPLEEEYIAARHQYKPTRPATIIEEYANLTSVGNRPQELELRNLLLQTLTQVKQEGATIGRENDMSYTIGISIVLVYTTLYSESVSEDKLEALYKYLDTYFGTNPKLDQLSSFDKQLATDTIFLSSFLLFVSYGEAAKKGNLAGIQEAKNGMERIISPLGFTRENLKGTIDSL